MGRSLEEWCGRFDDFVGSVQRLSIEAKLKIMAELAIKPMTLDEFLRWDDGTETHYELIGGFPVAMAPPAEAHSVLTVRLVTRIDAGLSARRPCRA